MVIPTSNSNHLRRVLSTPLLTLYGLGVTVGAGIYVLVGATTAEAGIYAPISFLIAAIVVSFTAFSYAELSTRFPVSAGEAAYVEAGFRNGPLATFVGLAVASSGILSSAAISIGAASYLHELTAAPLGLLTVLIVFTMGLIALCGIKESVMTAAIITVIEIGGLILVIIWGMVFAESSGVEVSQMLPPTFGPHWIGIGGASLLAFFAFVGFEDMVNVAEEVRDPVHAMPRAILMTLVLATVLYICTATAALLSVPIQDLSASAAPLSLVFSGAPENVQSIFSIIAIVATINGVLIQMIMSSRVIFGLADRGHLPAPFARISARTKTPDIATITVVLIIGGLALSLPIQSLAQHTSQIVLLVFIIVNVALIRLKLRGNDDGPPHFSVSFFVPVLGVATSVLLFATAIF